MLVALLIVVSAAFLLTLGMLLFRPSGAPALAAPQAQKPRGELVESDAKVRARLEADLERKRKELDEQRTQLQEVKEQLKQAKRKNFEQRESEKGEKDLVRARADVERSASLQLEAVRGELAQAESEIARLRSEMDMNRGGRRPAAPAPVSAPAPAPVSAPAPAAAPVPESISAPAQPGETVVAVATTVVPAATIDASPADRGPRRYRELNDADREKMERLETTANKERGRAMELDRELKRVRGRADSQQRIFAASKSELELAKDKFKALEKRLNRTLLEKDLLRRAIKDLEKKTGMLAERTELTPDEMAASDQKVEEAARARATAEAAQQAAAQQAAPAEAAPASETAATEGTEQPASVTVIPGEKSTTP